MTQIPYVVNFWQTKINDNDRSVAIIGGALIDERLAELLKSFFILNEKIVESLLSPTGPLAANGTRNQLAYALGLIDKPTYEDIRIITKIRNYFAHTSSDISFASDEMLRGYTSTLVIPTWVGEPDDPTPDSPRGRFYSGVRGILWNLVTESNRLKIEDRRVEPESIYPLGNRDDLNEDDSGTA